MMNEAMNSVLAGYTAGVCGVIVGHPMDSAKVWLQTASETTAKRPITSSPVTSTGTAAASTPMKRTMSTMAVTAPSRQLTLRALYAGVSGPLLTVGWVQSINFCLYDSMRRTLHKREFATTDATSQDFTMKTIAISASAAGAVIAFFTNPLLVIKTKQQIMTWSFPKAFRDTFRPNPQQISLSNFYVGFVPHFLNESVGRGLYVGSYEYLKRCIRNNQDGTTTTIPQRMLCAGGAGTLSCAVMFPLDALRSRLIASSLAGGSTSNVLAMAHKMFQEGGLKPFYRGFGVTVLRAGPVAAAVLPIYDVTLEWLNS